MPPELFFLQAPAFQLKAVFLIIVRRVVFGKDINP